MTNIRNNSVKQELRINYKVLTIKIKTNKFQAKYLMSKPGKVS